MPYMFLNGGGMRGGSLHHLLRGAPLVAETRTAPLYRLYSVGDRYPALQLAGDTGAAIAGVIGLADGTAALGMILRHQCPPLDDLTDITGYGGWRNYLTRHGPGG
jgi:gamma-glutamylcyclotransferase (GGCT)/AIG2-like uncharacterized protein YtfP